MTTILLLAGLTAGAPPTFDQVVRKVTATVEPASAKPGQTVTFRVALEIAPGWHTYPSKQPDPNADGQVNKITFPPPGDVVFVGELQEPTGYKTKAEPILDIKELRYYEGTAVWERKLVVSPKAKPGKVEVKLAQFRVSACDKDTCLVPKTVPAVATLTILDGPPVAVEAKYQAEIERATSGK